MVIEKGLTFAEAQMAAAAKIKIMAGVGIAGAAKSASDIYLRKVRSNRRRLVR